MRIAEAQFLKWLVTEYSYLNELAKTPQIPKEYNKGRMVQQAIIMDKFTEIVLMSPPDPNLPCFGLYDERYLLCTVPCPVKEACQTKQEEAGQNMIFWCAIW